MNRGLMRRSPATQGWIATFTDLAALILAFFVLTFSMQTIRVEDLYSPHGETRTALPADFIADPPDAQKHGADPDRPVISAGDRYLATVLTTRLASLGLGPNLEVGSGMRGLDVTLRNLVTSNAGRWSLAPNAMAAINEILQAADANGRQVILLVPRGRDDDIETSLARGDAVLKVTSPDEIRTVLVTDAPDVSLSNEIGFRLQRE